MKSDIVPMLACPNCKGDLEISVSDQQGQDILEGELTCLQCHEIFPINEGIPNLLPTNTHN